jgi:hypothetical protein
MSSHSHKLKYGPDDSPSYIAFPQIVCRGVLLLTTKKHGWISRRWLGITHFSFGFLPFFLSSTRMALLDLWDLGGVLSCVGSSAASLYGSSSSSSSTERYHAWDSVFVGAVQYYLLEASEFLSL